MENYETPKDQLESTLNKEKDINSNSFIKESSDDSTEVSKEEYKKISNTIHELENQSRIWRKKREELNSQVIEKTKSRNLKNDEVKKAISQANSDKAKRDELNKKISDLKSQKQIIESELKTMEKIHENAESKLEPVEIPKNMHSQLKRFQKEIKDLEWKLQTQSFGIEDERRLVDRIAELDQKIESLAEFKNLSEEKINSYHKLKKLRRSMHKLVKEINLLVKESRIHHNSMIENYSKANSLRKEADLVHSEIQKIKTQADLIHGEYIEKVKTRRTLANRIKKYSQKLHAEQKSKEAEVIKEKTTNVLQKTKDGKKISFDDFKSLIDLGLI